MGILPSRSRQGTHKALVGLDNPSGGLDSQHLPVLLRDPPLKFQRQTGGVSEGEEAGGGAAHPGGLEKDAFMGVQLQLQRLLTALHGHLLGPVKGGQCPDIALKPWLPQRSRVGSFSPSERAAKAAPPWALGTGRFCQRQSTYVVTEQEMVLEKELGTEEGCTDHFIG